MSKIEEGQSVLPSIQEKINSLDKQERIFRWLKRGGYVLVGVPGVAAAAATTAALGADAIDFTMQAEQFSQHTKDYLNATAFISISTLITSGSFGLLIGAYGYFGEKAMQREKDKLLIPRRPQRVIQLTGEQRTIFINPASKS